MRRGLSLLEIIVALAVLTATAALLAEMVSLATRHAERAREITEAQTTAHNILSELLAGLRPWQASETFQPVDLWSPWDYRLELAPVGVADLVSVTVWVRERPDETTATDGEMILDQSQVMSPRNYRLTRWVPHDLGSDELGSELTAPREQNALNDAPDN